MQGNFHNIIKEILFFFKLENNMFQTSMTQGKDRKLKWLWFHEERYIALHDLADESY